MDRVIVRPVIALNVDGIIPPPETVAGKFAAEIKEQAPGKGYFRYDSEAWYVPLPNLMDRIEAVASFLLFEAAHWREFELGGGFEIVIPGGRRMGVTPGSIFRCAVDLAQAVSRISPENPAEQAFIENDRYLNMALDGSTITISRGHRARRVEPREVTVPAQELKDGMAEAEHQLRQFAEAIEPLLTGSTNPEISPALVRFMFGLA